MTIADTSVDRQTRSTAVSLEVNGKCVPLNPFVTGLFASTIKGMVDALKLEEPPREISIQVTLVRSD